MPLPKVYPRGFTLVELLVTLAILAILAASGFYLAIASTQSRQNTFAAAESITHALRQAHVNSRETKSFLTWGVKFNSNQYLLRTKDPVTSSTATVTTYSLPPKITIAATPFTVWFDYGTGNLQTPRTITLIYNNSTPKYQIDIQSTGLIESHPL